MGGGRAWSVGGHLLTFSAFRMGAYLRWALIRGWALIRINTVLLQTLSYVLICVEEMESLNPIMSLSQGTLSNDDNHPQYLSGLLDALFTTTFHKIAVYKIMQSQYVWLHVVTESSSYTMSYVVHKHRKKRLEHHSSGRLQEVENKGKL